jgi:hypothetical protein
MDQSIGIKIKCCCGNEFIICIHCFKGQTYCSNECKSKANTKAHRRSQSLYAKSTHGRKKRQEAQIKNRKKKNSNLNKYEKNNIEADTTSALEIILLRSNLTIDIEAPASIRINDPENMERMFCRGCGKAIDLEGSLNYANQLEKRRVNREQIAQKYSDPLRR